MRTFARGAVVIAAAASACTPALNWRDVRPPAAGVKALFPCRPDERVRSVAIGAQPIRWTLLACDAADATFALSYADVADPLAVGPALAALRGAASGNVEGHAETRALLPAQAAAFGAGATRLHIDGHFPDGRAAHLEAAFFSRGTWVYQASIVGTGVEAATIDTFFSSLGFGG